MEKIHTQALLNGQLATFLLFVDSQKRQPIDHLIELGCVFSTY